MSKEIVDRRVVEMRFDNKQFETGAKETMGTLKRLKEALKFPDIGKSFSNIQKASDKVDMNGLGKVVEGVKLKFSALEVAAITALSNITNRAVDAGVRLAKSLSLDQVFAGFDEYELKMGSIQTIMASTGESLSTVNKYLEDLNEYSDKTIYSFSDMTNSIGKFTNAGVKLDDAVKAIQGVSNVAAISGANANEASRAMYNFAQALSAGSVKLIDWKSIELANMGTVEFKQSLIDTAVAMGTLVKVGDKYESITTDLNGNVSELFDSTSMFNDSLSAQWMTTDVLVQTLGNYSTDIRTMTDAEKEAYREKLRGIGYTEEQIKTIEKLGMKAFDSAQDVKTLRQLLDTMKESVGSGWAQTFELIIGDFEEAKSLWTNVNNTLGSIIQESSDSRNELLKEWKEAGGRDALLGGVSNAFNSLLSIVKAVKKAFRDVFPKTTASQLVKITNDFEDLTSKLIISDDTFNKLSRTFSGLFSVINILGQGVGALFKLVTPGVSIVGDLNGGILGVTASMGDWVVNLDKAIKKNGWFIGAVDKIHNALGKLVGSTDEFIDELYEKFKTLFNLEDVNVDDILNDILTTFKNLSKEAESFDLKNVEDAFNSLGNKIKDFLHISISNEGFSSFVKNFKQFVKDLKEAFTLDNLLDRVERVMDVFGKFFNWVKTTMAPAFQDFNFGSFAAAGSGIGFIYALIKAAKAFEKISGSISAIPDLLGGVKGTLLAYQKELQAGALIKVAGAIAILAGAITILSFADTDKLMATSIALTLISGTLMLGISKLLEAVNKGKELNTALGIFSKGLSSTMKKFGRAMEIKAVGSAVKNFAESIAIIAASIIALGIMYNKDKDALMAGVDLVKMIGLAMVGIMAGMSILGNVLKGNGMKNFSKAAFGILSLSTSLTLCVSVLNKLFKMEFPSDWEFKVKVLAGMLAGLGVLALTLGAASRISGKNKLSSGTILSMAALLMMTVIALNKLFKMEFPSDWEDKITILGLIFASFGALMMTMGLASRLAGGSIKAAGTILSMCVFIGTIVAALMVLSIIPSDKLIKGAAALGLVLTTLGISLAGAGKVASKDSYKSVLAMAVAIGAITASLGILAMVPFTKLLKGAVALGGVLLVLAEDFKQISKITNEKSWLVIAAMVAAVLGISVSLYALSEQPWEGLLSSALSLSAVLLSIAQTLKMISGMSGVNMEKISLFLLATTSLIPIGTALYTLSSQPWANMLAAGAALSLTLLAFSEAFSIISASNPDLASISAFLAASAGVGLIALSIYELSKQPWENLLASSASLSLVLMAMSGAMGICTMVGGSAPSAIKGIGLLDLFIANFALVLVALGKIFQSNEAQGLMSGGAEILVGIGKAIGDFVGAIVNGVLTGVANSLPVIGEGLSGFMNAMSGFADGSKKFDESVLKGVGVLAASIIAITASEVIAGIGFFLGGAAGLISVATNLVLFIETLDPFLSAVKGIDSESMLAVKNLAEMIIIITAAEMLNGVSRFFGLGGKISDFGKELSEFGPYIKQFADTVKNVKPEAVQGAASAAEIMANLASKLPGIGGLAQKIFGTRSLAEFGEELVTFGPSIKQFADTVKNVKPEAVQGASSAAEIMASLATKLPAQGGLAQKIFGTRSLAEFGEELVKFGPKISQFSNQVKNIDSSSVTGTSSITSIMSNLANNLPSSESLWNKIFGGGQVSLSDFGEELIKFGTSMSNFSSSVSGINPEQMSGAISSFKDLTNLASSIKNVDATGLTDFTDQLSKIGTESVSKFIQAFVDAGPKATEAVNNLFSSVITALNTGGSNVQNTAMDVGKKLGSGLQSGINQAKPNVISTENVLATSMINKMRSSLPSSTFNSIGRTVTNATSSGINSGRGNVINAASSVANSATNAVRSNLTYNSFHGIGSNAARGLSGGISSRISEIAHSAIDAARSAINAAKNALGIHSPSKVFKDIGKNVSIGLSDGISNNIKTVSYASDDLANTAINAAKGAINQIADAIDSGESSYHPIITPVVDLSDVTNAANRISSTFNSLDLSKTLDLAQSVSYEFSRNKSSSASKELYDKNVERKIDQLIKDKDDNPRTEIINTFYVKSTDPKEAAEEINYIMQHEVERGKATWAK